MRQPWLHKIIDFLKRKEILIFLISLLFLLVCGIGIKHQIFWIPFTVFVLLFLYLLFFKMDILLYLTAFFTPLSLDIKEYIPAIEGIGLSLPSEPLMIALAFVFLTRILYENNYTLKISKHPITLAVVFYLIWMFITSVTSSIPLVSFKFLASKLWFIIPFYFFLSQLIEKKYQRSITFFFAYALGLSIVVVKTTFKHIQLGDVEKVSHWIMSPYYNDHTAYGAVLAFFVCVLGCMLFVPILSKKQKLLSGIMFIIMSVGLYLSFSRAAWLSLLLAIGVLILLLFRIKLKSILLFIAGFFILIFTFQSTLLHQLNQNEQESSDSFIEHIRSSTNISSDASNVERLNRWYSAIRMFKEKPIFGFGPGTYQFKYASFQRSKYKTIISTNSGDGGNAHSEYLGPLSESGIVGMLSVFILVIICLYKSIYIYHHEKERNIRIISLMCTLSLVSYYTHGFLNNFLDTDKLAVPVFGAMAVITALDIIRKDKKIEISKTKNNE